MPELLAPTAAVVGIVATAAHSARLLLNDFKDIKHADKAIEPTVTDLNSVSRVLDSLKDFSDNNEDIFEGQNVQITAKQCDDICKSFRGKLTKWTKHSTPEKMAFRDKVNVGFFSEKAILQFRQELVACKGTFTIALLMTSIQSSASQTKKADGQIQRLDEVIAMLKAKEEAVNQEGALVLSRINDIDTEMQNVAETQTSDEQEAHFPAIRSAFESVLTEARRDLTTRKIKIGNVTQGNQSRALVGGHGLEEEYQKLDLEIGDVAVGDSSKAAIGVTRGIDLKDFFK